MTFYKYSVIFQTKIQKGKYEKIFSPEGKEERKFSPKEEIRIDRHPYIRDKIRIEKNFFYKNKDKD